MASKKIMESKSDIEVMDGLLFRDTAFPEGGWKLEQLLVKQTRDRLRQSLDVDYLVLIGPMQLLSESNGHLFPLVAGAISGEKYASMSAVILDLQSGNLIKKIDAISQGKGLLISYLIFSVGHNQDVELGTMEGLTNEIVHTLRALKPFGHIRIAVMAAEPGLIFENTQPEKLKSESNATMQK